MSVNFFLWTTPSFLFSGYGGGGGVPPGVKRPGREDDHSPPSSAEVNAWSYTSTPPIRLHGVVLS